MTRLAVAVLLVLALLVLATLPPRAIPVDQTKGEQRLVRGVMHVHTRRSDGSGTVADVAAAAARSGLQFVVVTDHGDGMREPDPPAYMDGVLVIDAVEVTTTDGHVLGLGHGRAPYRLAGAGADVVEDINRLGGFAIAAHVDSAKPSLTWRAWDAALTGFEWLNADSEWRDESRWSLAGLLLPYVIRPAGALARMLDRPELTLSRWDDFSRDRRLLSVAAADAHARMGGGEDDDARWWQLSLPLPGYASLFQTFSLSLTGVALTGRPVEDADLVLGALERGHSFTVVDALAGPAYLDFVATSGLNVAIGGDALPLAGPVRVQARIAGPPGARITLIRDGVPVSGVEGTSLDREFPQEAAVYRVEVGLPAAPGAPPVPWVLSNPIFAGRGAEWGRPPVSGSVGAPVPAERVTRTPQPDNWTVEHSTPSEAAVDVVTAGPARKETLFRYALSGPESAGPFAAAVLPVEGLAGAGAVQLHLRADKPMRVSVELRVAGPNGDERWRRSAYLDGTSRTVTLQPGHVRPLTTGQTARPEMAGVRSVLVVVDTVNTPSGSAGRIWIESVEVLAQAAPPERR